MKLFNKLRIFLLRKKGSTNKSIEEKVSAIVEEIPEKSPEQALSDFKEKISQMSNEEIYENMNFSVYQIKTDNEYFEEEDEYQENHNSSIENSKWYVYMSICCLGGCNYNGVQFDTERKALEYSMLLTLQGKKTSIKYACSECYVNYMKDCI